jgi:ubiquinone/menaquinone biosynthesis C-methylase UbiE
LSDGHPIFAALYDRSFAAAERRWLGERRSTLLSKATGSVLEIGGGTGANLPHYVAASRIVVAEPDPHMLGRLRPKLGLARVPVEVSEAGAEELPFADASFDVVVSTLVLCTVPDQMTALAEVRRVLTPGGGLLFMEHVRGEGAVARVQDLVLPLWRCVCAGCHPNRDTLRSIRASGFEVGRIDRFTAPGPFTGLVPFVQGGAVAP